MRLVVAGKHRCRGGKKEDQADMWTDTLSFLLAVIRRSASMAAADNGSMASVSSSHVRVSTTPMIEIAATASLGNCRHWFWTQLYGSVDSGVRQYHCMAVSAMHYGKIPF